MPRRPLADVAGGRAQQHRLRLPHRLDLCVARRPLRPPCRAPERHRPPRRHERVARDRPVTIENSNRGALPFTPDLLIARVPFGGGPDWRATSGVSRLPHLPLVPLAIAAALAVIGYLAFS